MKRLLVVMMLSVLGCAGPSKSRLRVLLSECREQNREHVRLWKEAANTCEKLPEQHFGAIGYGEAGN